MALNTGIAWTDDTHNLWWGCVERGPGCAKCYAKALATRYGWDVWGPNKPRRMFADGHVVDLAKYQRAAQEAGASRRVFVGSMMDLAEERADTAPIVRRFLASVEMYDGLDFLLVTKRPENYEQILRDVFPAGRLPRNIWLGVTAVTQSEIDRFAPLLADLSRRWGAAAAFLSIEPQIESVHVPRASLGDGGITWLITGGESATGGARPYAPAWSREIIADAREAGIAPFVKQLGSAWARSQGLRGKGDVLADWPEDLRVQEFPLPRRALAAASRERGRLRLLA